MVARIYKPTKTAMQSGWAQTKAWVIEFESRARKDHEPLMGWTTSGDTRPQVRLRFETREEAEAYAKARNIAYTVIEPTARTIAPKSYAANFAWNRVR
jgi:hypothetical protein